jgi:hypothetical protein
MREKPGSEGFKQKGFPQFQPPMVPMPTGCTTAAAAAYHHHLSPLEFFTSAAISGPTGAATDSGGNFLLKDHH